MNRCETAASTNGQVIAQDYRKGQKMVAERNFQDNASFFQVRAAAEVRSIHMRTEGSEGNAGSPARRVLVATFNSSTAAAQDVFEVGRRFRIMNPDRMRSTYGLLMYMLMDSAEATIQELLEFKCVRPLRTVYARLGARPGTLRPPPPAHPRSRPSFTFRRLSP